MTTSLPPVRTWAPAQFPADSTLTAYAQALVDIVQSGQLRGGRHTDAFENEVRAFFDAHTVAVGSGMDALELLLEAYGAHGRRVLVPAHCFQAIPALIARLGGTPVPLPVDPATLAPLPDVAAEDGAVLIWVHHAGLVADYAQPVIERLRRGGTTVIEDCAYVLPDTRVGPGSWGDSALFSFAPTKPMSGCGGAVIVTKASGLAAELHARRTHSGVEKLWEAGDQLLRWRGLSEPDALLALWRWRQHPYITSQLAHIRSLYSSHLLEQQPGLLPAGRTPGRTWGRYTVDLGELDAGGVQRALADRGIHSSVMAPVPWFDYPALSAYAPAEEPRGLRALLRRTIALPYHPRLSDKEVERTCRALLAVIDTEETTT